MPHSPPQSDPGFLDHLTRESARFRDVLTDTDPTAPVPTCPEWNADDLLWHLGEVQWFWGEVAERGLTTAEQVKAVGSSRVVRPRERPGLFDHFDRASERLHRVLSALAPETEVWMWADDHTAAYIARRQAHEALIHRLDAELTAGLRTSLDADLAADGVDEALTVMRGYEPEDGLTHTTLGGTVLLTVAAAAPPRMWSVQPVRVTGPSGGDVVDLGRLLVEPVDLPRSGDGRPSGMFIPCAAAIDGGAEDVDCWLWNRPLGGALHRRGDAAALAALDSVIAGPIG